MAGLLLIAAGAAPAQIVPVPKGTPMGPDPVAAKAEPIAKSGMIDGVARTWLEYVPASYTGKTAVPLVVAVHGGNADARWMFGATAWAQIADVLGIIVVYPNGSIGSGGKLRWNGYAELNTDPDMAISEDNHVDEARFFKTLIEQVEARYNIDRTRIYMHGQSNGGMMTNYFGLRYPGMLAAMGVSSAPPSIEVMQRYHPATPLPVYFWDGETDTVAGQYNPAHKSRPVLNREFVAFWAAVNHAAATPALRLDGPYNTQIFEGTTEVRGTEFRNGIHTLPFTTAYMVWNDFFSRFRRAPSGAIERIVPDTAQSAPADAGAVMLKLGAPFAQIGTATVRVGDTPDQAPVLVPGVPSAGVLVPAPFAETAFGLVATQPDPDTLVLTRGATALRFTIGARRLSVDGKETPLDIATRRTDGATMVSLAGVARALGLTVSTRNDVYRNDVYYLSSRPADLSAQVIALADRRLGAPSRDPNGAVP